MNERLASKGCKPLGVSAERENWWTLCDRIRTESEFEVLGAVFVQNPYLYMVLAPEAVKLRKLGMTYRKIAAALDTDDKLVRKAIEYAKEIGLTLKNSLPFDDD